MGFFSRLVLQSLVHDPLSVEESEKCRSAGPLVHYCDFRDE